MTLKHLLTPAPIIMKIEDWPNHDRQAWEAALVAGGLFDDDGAFAHLSNGTESLRRQHYGQWLSFIHRKHPALINDGIGDRVTLATVKGFVEDARTRLTTRRHPRTGLREGARPLSLRTVADLVRSLNLVLRGLEPATEWTWLRSVANKLYQRSDPYRLKPPIPITAHQLYHWSLDRLQALMNEEQLDPFERATAFRQTLMIGILIWAPVRCRALMAMTVSGHVNRTSESYWLRFRAGDMKNKKPRSYLLPAAFVGATERYLQEFRPILLQGNLSDALWISRRGNPMSEDSFSSGLVLVTTREFGCELSPHSFRHIAATTIAECAPEHANIIRDILGHATLAMAERHYNRATGQKACADYQAIIRDTIKGAKARDRKAKRSRKTRRKKHNPQEEY